MRNYLCVLLVSCVVGFSPVLGFDVSPTQTTVPASAKKAVVASPELLSLIGSNKAFENNIELLTLSDDGKQLSSLRGHLSEPLEGNLETAARNYVLTNSKLFNLPTSQKTDFLKTVKNLTNDGVSHITFGWEIDGTRVQHALIELHIGKDKVVQLVNGSFPTINEISNKIAISEKTAIETANQALGIKVLRGVAKSEMVVLPVGNGMGKMAYLVRIPASDPLGDWEIYIDAETQKEISHLNQMVFADTGSASESEGIGSVYVHHPFAGPAENVKLYHLTKTSLSGLFADVGNATSPVAVSSTFYHVYDPVNTHFDETNVYFYMTNIHDFFYNLGFKKLDRPLHAVVHYGNNYDNAAYSSFSDEIIFGDGGKRFYDLAKEEAVTYHEYSHAHLAQIVQLDYSGESGAMNEGQADYFACSFSDDPKIGEYVASRSSRPWLRNLTDKVHYPEDISNEVHADSRIWSATLWDLRLVLGGENMDKLVEGSLYYLKSGDPTFIDGYNALLTADVALNRGINGQKITQAFQARGIVKTAFVGAFDSTDLKTMNVFKTLHKD
ncbi:MAG: M36 family metallopeptidase [Candidatus Riflebacteria bacterium]|nr:M36 family metallopeptidase [Candidatus Riflebacteria bacterium]